MDRIFNAEAATEHAEEALHLTAASTEQQIAILLVLLVPLAGFLLTGLVGRRLGRRPWIISITAVLVSAGIATWLAFGALTADVPQRIGFTLYTWIPVGDLQLFRGPGLPDILFLTSQLLELLAKATLGGLMKRVHAHSNERSHDETEEE